MRTSIRLVSVFALPTRKTLAQLRASDRVSFRFVYDDHGRLSLSEIVVVPPVVTAQS